MEVTDLDFQRLIAQAGSAESNECEDTNQKAEQIKPPMRYQDIPHDRLRRNIARRSSRLSFQATPIIVWRKECKSPFRETSNCGAGPFVAAVRNSWVDTMENATC